MTLSEKKTSLLGALSFFSINSKMHDFSPADLNASQVEEHDAHFSSNEAMFLLGQYYDGQSSS